MAACNSFWHRTHQEKNSSAMQWSNLGSALLHRENEFASSIQANAVPDAGHERTALRPSLWSHLYPLEADNDSRVDGVWRPAGVQIFILLNSHIGGGQRNIPASASNLGRHCIMR